MKTAKAFETIYKNIQAVRDDFTRERGCTGEESEDCAECDACKHGYCLINALEDAAVELEEHIL